MTTLAEPSPAVLDPARGGGSSGSLLRRRARFVGGTARWTDAPAALWALAGGRGGDARRVERLHAELRRLLKVPHVFTYGAGRMALYETLAALGVGEGDEVILPGYTCAVVANAVRFTGATPVYADIELERLGPDPDAVRGAITPRTRAIVSPHLFGLPCRVDELVEIGRTRGVAVIEDAAMALGGRDRGRPLGTIADAGFFSSERTKMISTINGGILVTRDGRLAAELERRYADLPVPEDRDMRLALRKWLLDLIDGAPSLGRIAGKLLARVKRGAPFACETFDRAMYDEEYAGRRIEGYPWRLHGGLAGIATRQLRRLEGQVRHRARLAAELADVLERKGAGVPRVDPATAEPSWLRFPFWVDDVEAWAGRLRAAGIECHRFCRWFEGPLHPGACIDNPWFRYERGVCPRGEWLGERILNVPVHPRVGRWMIERIRKM